jgi:hypothetical protein
VHIHARPALGCTRASSEIACRTSERRFTRVSPLPPASFLPAASTPSAPGGSATRPNASACETRCPGRNHATTWNPVVVRCRAPVPASCLRRAGNMPPVLRAPACLRAVACLRGVDCGRGRRFRRPPRTSWNRAHHEAAHECRQGAVSPMPGRARWRGPSRPAAPPGWPQPSSARTAVPASTSRPAPRGPARRPRPARPAWRRRAPSSP